MKPATLAEWSDAVLATSSFLHAVPPEWRLEAAGEWVDYGEWRSLIEFSPEDLVVRAQAGMTLAELQSVLAQSGRMVPVGFSPMPFDDWTLAELIAINPPHTGDIERGGWRDWVLGLTLLLGDGRVVKVGSSAVKNVAGYDVQKLIVGSRGTLAVVLEVTLVVSGQGHQPQREFTDRDRSETVTPPPWWIQRVALADVPHLQPPPGAIIDAESGTLWCRTEEPLKRFAGDWVMRPGTLVPESEAIAGLWRRAKDQFDPRGVLNGGYLEVAHV